MAYTHKARLSTGLILSIGLLSPTTSAHAGFRVAAYQDTLGYAQIADTDYQAAQQRTAPRHRWAQRYTVSSNRCIAQLMADQAQAALESCTEALANVPAVSSQTFPLRSRRAALATILSNRGVVHMALGEPEQAERDFQRAARLDNQHELPRFNLRYLSQWRLSAAKPGLAP